MGKYDHSNSPPITAKGQTGVWIAVELDGDIAVGFDIRVSVGWEPILWRIHLGVGSMTLHNEPEGFLQKPGNEINPNMVTCDAKTRYRCDLRRKIADRAEKRRSCTWKH
jgi:hypothetical protein